MAKITNISVEPHILCWALDHTGSWNGLIHFWLVSSPLPSCSSFVVVNHLSKMYFSKYEMLMLCSSLTSDGFPAASLRKRLTYITKAKQNEDSYERFKAKACGHVYGTAPFEQGAPPISSASITKDGTQKASAFSDPWVTLRQLSGWEPSRACYFFSLSNPCTLNSTFTRSSISNTKHTFTNAK